MKAAKDLVVTFHYTLTDDAGTAIDSSSGREPLSYLHGHGNIVPGLETALEGVEAGFKSNIKVTAADGYGARDPEAVFVAPRDQFPDDMDLAPGTPVYAEGPQGPVAFTVLEITDEGVRLDANHPLAGVDLNFEIEVTEVRPASAEELDHGHVHGQGGHEH
jgi:FKBP-type peptidyl-prolyl cis-trans isomerase SlyD